jgi:hypothetical protein
LVISIVVKLTFGHSLRRFTRFHVR